MSNQIPTIFYCGPIGQEAMGGLFQQPLTYDPARHLSGQANFLDGNTDITGSIGVAFYSDVAQTQVVQATVQLSPPVMATWGSYGLVPMGIFVANGVMYRYAIAEM